MRLTDNSTNRNLYLTYGMAPCLVTWLTSKRVARVCQHQLSFLYSCFMQNLQWTTASQNCTLCHNHCDQSLLLCLNISLGVEHDIVLTNPSVFPSHSAVVSTGMNVSSKLCPPPGRDMTLFLAHRRYKIATLSPLAVTLNTPVVGKICDFW